jgi:hypothetical protein
MSSFPPTKIENLKFESDNWALKVGTIEAEEKALIRRFRKSHKLLNVHGIYDNLSHEEKISLLGDMIIQRRQGVNTLSEKFHKHKIEMRS